MSKYNWSDVPLNTKYIATDADGYAHGWSGNEPKPDEDDNGWNGSESEVTMFMINPSHNPFKGDWRDSLEQRP